MSYHDYWRSLPKLSGWVNIPQSSKVPNGRMYLILRYGVLEAESKGQGHSIPMYLKRASIEEGKSALEVVVYDDKFKFRFLCDSPLHKLQWVKVLEKSCNWKLESFYKVPMYRSRGEHSKVMEATHRETGKTVAIKEIQTNYIKNENEVNVVTTFGHPNIMHAIEVLRSSSTTFIVLPLMQGDLSNLVIKHGPFGERKVRDIMSQIIEGVRYLHEEGLVHRKISASNVLFEKAKDQIVVKINGFRSCSVLVEDSNKRCEDISACGELMYLLLCGVRPSKSYSCNDNEVSHVLFHHRLGSGMSDDAKSLIRLMLDPKANKKLSAGDVIAHKWFN